MSIIDPLTCGFAKVAIYSLFIDIQKDGGGKLQSNQSKIGKAELFKELHTQFNDVFAGYKNFVTSYDNMKIFPHKIKEKNI